MADTVDEGTISASLIAMVVCELDSLDPGPPQDEYAAGHELPPAYNSFEDVYAFWHTADEAKQAIVELDRDPAVASTERMLKEARDALNETKKMSEEAFKALQALHPKINSFASFFGHRKSKRKPSSVDLPPNIGDLITTGIPLSTDHRLTEEFKRAHEAQLKQDQVVERLEERVAEFNHKREALNKVASGGNLAWIQIRQIADERMIRTPEVALGMGELMESLQGAENVHDVARKKTTDLTRARLAVQNSHVYFTNALKICDSVRGTPGGRALLGVLGGGGGMNDAIKMIEYKQSVIQASKAQICLNEVFRILDPREHMIPEDRMGDYKELKTRGVMQMSKIYNLMFGGRSLPSGVAGSVKLMLDRQEAAFAHLTRLAVWIQDVVPVCTTEEKAASILRDDARREVAAFLYANISHDGEA